MSQDTVAAFTPQHYFNRELSWLQFNGRVLEEARDPTNPLLERLKFICIFSSNLDEFFEVRVAGLQQQLHAGLEPQDYAADGLEAAEQLAGIDRGVHELVAAQYRCLNEEIWPSLAANGIERVRPDQLDGSERAYLEAFFAKNVYPVLTPLAIDPGHPFPHVHNKSLNIAVLIETENAGPLSQMFGVVQVPSVLDRLVQLPRHGDRFRFVLLEDVIAPHLGELFGGCRVLGYTTFRVTRNTDLEVQEDEADDLLQAIEDSLRQRIRGDAVRLELSAGADEPFVQMLDEALDLEPRDVYRIDGPLDLTARWHCIAWTVRGHSATSRSCRGHRRRSRRPPASSMSFEPRTSWCTIPMSRLAVSST